MLRNNTLLLITFSFFILPSSIISAAGVHNDAPVELIMLHGDRLNASRSINPYIINIVAIYEVEKGRHMREVGNYLQWYLDHLNYPDVDGLTGTIYNYKIGKAGKLSSTNDYDSVDGYAGTFLYVLNLYHQQTKDHSFIQRNWKQINDIAYLIPYLQSEDGLIIVKHKSLSNVKYLMDNCEAYGGIRAFQELAVRAGYKRDPYYVHTKKSIQEAVLGTMYDKNKENFYWAVDDKVKHASNWQKLYPDALAQIFPIYFDLLPLNGVRANTLWRGFNIRHGFKIERLPLEQQMIYELMKEKTKEIR